MFLAVAFLFLLCRVFLFIFLEFVRGGVPFVAGYEQPFCVCEMCRGTVDLLPGFFMVFRELWLKIGDINFMDCPEELQQRCQTSLRRNFPPYGNVVIVVGNF